MLGKITSINENTVEVALESTAINIKNIVNYHVIFEETDYKLLGEVKEVTNTVIKVSLLGEIKGQLFLSGVIRRPSLGIACRVIQKRRVRDCPWQ